MALLWEFMALLWKTRLSWRRLEAGEIQHACGNGAGRCPAQTEQAARRGQILYSSLLYSTLLYSTLLYHTILYYTILYYTILVILYYTIIYYTRHTILLYSILYYTILYYTILYYTLPPRPASRRCRRCRSTRSADAASSHTPSPPIKSFPIKSPWVKLSGIPPIKFYGHENSHPLELRVCLRQTLWNPIS